MSDEQQGQQGQEPGQPTQDPGQEPQQQQVDWRSERHRDVLARTSYVHDGGGAAEPADMTDVAAFAEYAHGIRLREDVDPATLTASGAAGPARDPNRHLRHSTARLDDARVAEAARRAGARLR